MILDLEEFFLTTLGSESLGGSTTSQSDYRDNGVAEANDGHRKKYLNIEGVSNLTSDGADTVTITLVSDTAVGFATNKTTHYTSGAIAKDEIAAKRLKIALPEGMYRYMRVEWTVTAIGSKTVSTGLFKAFISNS